MSVKGKCEACGLYDADFVEKLEHWYRKVKLCRFCVDYKKACSDAKPGRPFRDVVYLGPFEMLLSKHSDRLSELLGCKIVMEETRTYTPRTDVSVAIYCDTDGQKEPVGTFRLTELPGCCGYLVSHNTVIKPDWQGKKINQMLQELKVDYAGLMGYTTLMATTSDKNEAQNHIMKKHGWTAVDEVVNRRTGNVVYTWLKRVK